MNSTRKIATITGVIFIIATVAVLVANAFTPVLTGADYLTRFSAHTNQVAAGALLYLIGYFASAGIAVVMYPVLKKWNAGLALGSVVFRTIEAAIYMVGLVACFPCRHSASSSHKRELPIVPRFRLLAIRW